MLAGTSPINPDTDDDGLPDGKELNEYDSNPTVADTDDDGLDDGPEINQYETDPMAADTDNDGLEDGREINQYETNPTAADTDNDGLEDGPEVNQYGTDPTAADTDDDGLEDGPEVNQYGTDPTAADTDDDGLEDEPEIDQYGTDPTAADTDDDGLEDEPEIDQYGTDPTRSDTDSDGLEDRLETLGSTSPTTADTDDDGLEDGPELDQYGTDPTAADTDGDGLNDIEEVQEHTDDGEPIPNADPTHMDLYVQIAVSSNAEALSSNEIADIKSAWEQMPVENPDGSTGITAHIVQTRLSQSVVYDGSSSGFSDLEERFYTQDVLGSKYQGPHRLVLVVPIDSNSLGGRGRSPGQFSVIDAEDTSVRDGYTYRTTTIIHELLHNVMGELDKRNQCPSEFDEFADVHSCEGWLSYDDGPSDYYLPTSLANEIEDDGLLP